MKTQAEYRESFAHCPQCDSDEIEGDSFDCTGDAVTQEVTCLKCGAEWEDVYTLDGFNPLSGFKED